MSIKLRYILAAIVFIIVVGVVGNMDFEDAKRAERAYCAEVDLYKRTRGAEGHPAYDGDDFCLKYSKEELRAMR